MPLMITFNGLKSQVDHLSSLVENEETGDRTEFRRLFSEVKKILSEIKETGYARTVKGLLESIKMYEQSRGRELTGFVRRTVTSMYEEC